MGTGERGRMAVMPPTPPTRRRWFQFGLGTMSLVVKVVAMVFAGLCMVVLMASVVVAEEKSDEAKAIESIELLGGRVERDDKLPNRPVIGVDFRGRKRVTDKYLHLLKAFPRMTMLSLSRTNVTDAGLKELRELTN